MGDVEERLDSSESPRNRRGAEQQLFPRTPPLSCCLWHHLSSSWVA